MAAKPPLTDAERARIIEAHSEGLSRAAIARELGRSADTVGKAATAAGLTWDRTRTEAATKAKQADNRARRANLVDRLYGQAEHLLDRLEAPTYTATGEDRDGKVITTLLERDAIPPQDHKQLGGMTANYLLTAARLEAIDSDAGAEQGRSMVADLAAGFASLYGQLGDTAKREG